ncbi:hypothetical protein JX266_013070 [Neoarthrinium moseri]|nr:hypothetical protein JX266_013070 [Neoarthrinium moseri]
MVVVAVAGGTGTVGRTMVDFMVHSGKHNVFVLTRGVLGPTFNKLATGLSIDYNNVNHIIHTLQENSIEVVVSALLLFNEAAFKSQINLIRGAAESTTVTKFIPSEYHINFERSIKWGAFPNKPYQIESVRELERHPRLAWTLIRNGLFMDYLGMPFHAKPTHLMSWCIFLDLEQETCVFPGDGEQTMIFTHSTDLAAYVNCLIDMPAGNWPRESLIMPCRIRLKDLARIMENITGRDFRVTYDSTDAIYNGQITQLPANKKLFSDPFWGPLYQLVEKEVVYTLLSDGYDLSGQNLADLFPGVTPTDLEDFLRQSWKLKEEKKL